MSPKPFQPLFILFCILCIATQIYSQNPQNWTKHQLLEPSALAESITSKKEVPVIISIGPGATIPSSIALGMMNTEEGLQKLRVQLKSLSKEERIVVYCGCCPFEHCPNIRPAIAELKAQKFTNFYLLNLPANIKKDWIDKGYPVTK